MCDCGGGGRKWFSVDYKSFEISTGGKGSNLKGIIIKERRKGAVFWIKFGAVGLRNLCNSVETICREGSKVRRVFDRKEDRSYRVENLENDSVSFILCLKEKAF